MSEENIRAVDKKTFIVVNNFTDLKDSNKKYIKGDVYKTEGKPFDRIKELSSKQNKQKKVLIKEQE